MCDSRYTIEFAEELEDIIASLKEIGVLKNFEEGENAYISYLSNNFIIDRFEEEDGSHYFTVDVVQNGFYIENPNIRKFYKNIKFNKFELIDFINNFKNLEEKEYALRCINSKADWDIFWENFNKNKFIVLGINYNYFTNVFMDNGKLESILEDREILYLKNIKNEYYRFEFYTSNTNKETSYGKIDIQKIDKPPKVYHFEPLTTDYTLSLVDIGQDFNSLVFGMKSHLKKFNLMPFIFFDKIGYSVNDKMSGYAYFNYTSEELFFYFKKGNIIPSEKEIIKTLNI